MSEMKLVFMAFFVKNLIIFCLSIPILIDHILRQHVRAHKSYLSIRFLLYEMWTNNSFYMSPFIFLS